MQDTNLFKRHEQAVADLILSAKQNLTAPSGSQVFHSDLSDPDNDVTTVVGPAAGPAGVAQWVGDTTAPGVPTGITATSKLGIVYIAWDGTLEDGAPEDFGQVNLLVDGTPVGHLLRAGTLPVDGLTAGATVQVTATAQDLARAQDGTLAPNVSAACAPVSVTVESAVSQADLDAAQEEIDQAKTDITAAQNTANSALTTATGANSTATAAQAAASQAQSAADAAAQDAEDKSAAAQQAAITAAAADATAKADAAQAAATTAAAQDAQAKADAAKAAAISSASADAQAKANAAEEAAKTAAAADAAAKAQAAQSAAQAAAAQDAKAKADAAQAAANSYADQLHDALASTLADFTDETTQNFSTLQNQVDGAIDTWYLDGVPALSDAPASDWTDEATRAQHEGDLYFDKQSGKSYRFFKNGDTWAWTLVQDTDITKALADAADAQDTADSKRRVFVVQPTPPYDTGDLWTQGSGGNLMRCKTGRVSGSYVAADWELATKYTDDTVAYLAQQKATDAATAAADAKPLIQADEPTSDEQVQDRLWIDTAARTYAWTGTPNASTSQELVDGVVTRTNLFTSPETPIVIGISEETSVFNFPCTPGDIFSVSARVTPGSIFSGVLASSQGMSVHFIGPGNWYDPWWTPPSGGGTEEISFTIPSDCTSFDLTFHGATIDGDSAVTWDQVLLEQSSTVGAFFSGDTPSTPANTPKRWDGSQWAPVTDGTAVQAAQDAATAQTTANTAQSKATAAETAAAAAQSTADTAKSNATTAQAKADQAATTAAQAQSHAAAVLAASPNWITDPQCATGADEFMGLQPAASGAPVPPPNGAASYGRLTVRDTDLPDSMRRAFPTSRTISMECDVINDGTATLNMRIGLYYMLDDQSHWTGSQTSASPSDDNGAWKHLKEMVTLPAGVTGVTPWLQIDGWPPATSGWLVTNLSWRDVTEAQAAAAAAVSAQSAAQAAATAAANADAKAVTAQSTATAAQDSASQAQTTANGKNKVFTQNAEPSHTGLVPGDLWRVLTVMGDGSRQVTGQQVWNGSAFVADRMVADSILVPGSTGTVSIGDGAITTPKLLAGQIDGNTVLATNSVTAPKISATVEMLTKLLSARKIVADDIDVASLAAAIVTSGLFRTSATVGQATNGQGVIVSSDGVSGYGSDGTLKTRLGAGDGGLLAQNAVLQDASIVGGAVTMKPTEQGTTTTLYTSGFEADSDVLPWQKDGFYVDNVRSTAQHHSGTSSMYCGRQGSGYAVSYTSDISGFPIDPGCTITVAGWVYVVKEQTEGGPTSGNDFDVFLNPYNGYPQQDKIFTCDFNTWTHFSADFEVPYGSPLDERWSVIGMSPTVYGLNFYIDDLTIIRTPYGASAYFGLDAESGDPRITFYDDTGYPSFQADRHQVGFYTGKPNETPASINSVYQTDTDSSGSQTACHTTQINSGLINDGNMPTDENWIELTKWWYKTSAGDVTKWSTLELDSAEIILSGMIQWINGAPHINLPTLADLNSTDTSGGKAAATLLKSASHGWTGPIYGHVVNDSTAANNGDYTYVGSTWVPVLCYGSCTVSSTINPNTASDYTIPFQSFTGRGCAASSGVITVPMDGVYRISVNAFFESQATGNWRDVYTAINGTQDVHTNTSAGGDGNTMATGGTIAPYLKTLSAGDTVALKTVGGSATWKINPGKATLTVELIS